MGDWKETLFVWRGALVPRSAPGRGPVWTGTWVGVGPGEPFPSYSDFVESGNAFCMNLDWDAASGSWMVVGQYKLDNGDGYGEYSDIVQRIYALEKGGDAGVRLAGHPHSAPDSEPNFLKRQLVAAAGSTEFGNFFSKGHVCRDGGENGGFELTLCALAHYTRHLVHH